MSDPGTVFVIDLDSGSGRAVVSLAESLGLRAELYESAKQFLESQRPSEPGCVVAELRMPGMSGLELTEKLAAMGSLLPVILVSADTDVPTAVRAMRRGALTVLQKPCAPSELADSIREALQRNTEARRRAERLGAIRRRLETLTAAEQAVLELMSAGMRNKTIAERLNIGLRTVEARRHAIMHKLGAGSLAELLRMVFAVEAESCDASPSTPAALLPSSKQP